MYRYYLVEREVGKRNFQYMEKFRKLTDAYAYVKQRSALEKAHYPFRIVRITREVVFKEES